MSCQTKHKYSSWSVKVSWITFQHETHAMWLQMPADRTSQQPASLCCPWLPNVMQTDRTLLRCISAIWEWEHPDVIHVPDVCHSKSPFLSQYIRANCSLIRQYWCILQVCHCCFIWDASLCAHRCVASQTTDYTVSAFQCKALCAGWKVISLNNPEPLPAWP